MSCKNTMPSGLCLTTSDNQEFTPARDILTYSHTNLRVDQLVSALGGNFLSTPLDEETQLPWAGLQLFSNWNGKV